MARKYASARWSEEVIYSIMGDAYRLISSRARYWSDSSCVELSVDELESEGRLKLYKLISVQGCLSSIPNRKELFKYITCCVNNHFRGLVARHRFTAKRTGQKVAKQGSPEAANRDTSLQKPEISLDANPEIRGMLEFRAVVNHEQHSEGVNEDMVDTLTAFEYAVYSEMTNPSEATMTLASIDGLRGKVNRDITIRADHIAQALGIPVDSYHACVENVRRKFEAYRSNVQIPVPTIKPVSTEERETLTPVEFLVYQQLVSPNSATLAICKARRVTPGVEHLAEGVGLPTELFQKVEVSVRQKLTPMSSTKEVQAPNSTAVRALEKVFNVHVPRTLEAVIVRRLFTLAARAHYEKVTDEVASLLRSVGAEVPMMNSSGNLICFGTLYAKNHRVCSACHARIACAVKAANYGLDNVTLSPKLFAPRASVRTAEAGELPGEASPEERPRMPMSEREDELRSYLKQNFKDTTWNKEQYYTHKVRPADAKVRNIIWVGSKSCPEGSGDYNPAFMVRFVSPSTRVATQLVKVGNSFYARESMPVDDVIKLIDLHANELFSMGTPPPSEPKASKAKLRIEGQGLGRLIMGAVCETLKALRF